MADDRVLVPPEVRDELVELEQRDDLYPDDRERTREVASELDMPALERWLDQVGEDVYRRAAQGEFAAEDPT